MIPFLCGFVKYTIPNRKRIVILWTHAEERTVGLDRRQSFRFHATDGEDMIRMTMGRKLMFSFVTLLVFLLVLGYSSVSAVIKLGGALDRAVNQTAKKIDTIGSMREGFDQVEAQVRATQVGFGVQTVDTQGYCTFCHTADRITKATEKLHTAVTGVNGHLVELRPLMPEPGEQKVLEAL